MEETNLAVLIDFENIAAGTEKEGLGRFDVNALMARVKDKGRILVARSYADWGRFSRFKQALLTANVTMMELTSHGMQDKNRADIAMVVDALELAFTRDYINTFVVVSGDSDFTPMVLKMRELNKRIIGIGTRKSTSRLLIQACDEFIFYDAIVKKPAPSRRRKKTTKGPTNLGKALDLLEDTLMGLQRENPDPVHASVVKTTMLRKSPDFNENDLGYSSFARFLEAAHEAGLIGLERDRKSGGYRVLPPDDRDDDDEEDDVADTANSAAPWSDDYLPRGSERVMAVLEQAKLPMLSAAIRKDVLGAFEDTVAERKKKRRKVTISLVRDDMLKNRLRLTHPDLPNARLKSLLDGLLQGGELIHRDGTAIRSATASFHLDKDAKGLNESLAQLYLAHLVDAGADVSDTAMLAELFYGDRDQRRSIEQTLAWLASAKDCGSSDDRGRHDDSDDLDLDDLLVMDVADAPAKKIAVKEEKVEEPQAEEKPKRRRARKKTDDDEPHKGDDDAVATKADDAEAEEKPAKKPVRKRAPRKKKAEEPQADDAGADEKPKPKPRRRTRKKKEEPEPEPNGGDDLDALLEIG